MSKIPKLESSIPNRSHADFSIDDITGTDNKEPSMPATPGGLLNWLKKKQTQFNELQGVICAFLETRDTGLLNPFAPEILPQVTLEKHIAGPVAIFNPAGIAGVEDLNDYIRQQHEDVKKMFPGIEIREAKTISGEPRIVYIGADSKEVAAACRLCREQRQVAQAISLGKERLSMIVENTPHDSSTAFAPMPPRAASPERGR